MNESRHVDEDLFILGDGDRVRLQLEKHIFSQNLEEISSFSASLSKGIESLASAAQNRLGAHVVMAGGDDILLQVKSHTFARAALEELAEQFLHATGCTISFGVAHELKYAYLCLRKAKTLGGGGIVLYGASL